MSKVNFKALQERFSASTNSGSNQNNYYAYFKMPEDAQARVRFLPDANEENSLGFLVEKLSHSLKINGEKKTVACLSQYGEECPICKVAKDYYDVDDKVNGKLYYKTRNYVAQVLVLEDPIIDPKHENAVGKVKLLQLGYSLFKIIKDAFESGELDEAPYAFEGGTDFLIKKTKQGEFASYTLSKFARKSTDLSEDQITNVEANIVDLSTLLPKKPDLKLVNSLLESALTGKRISDDDGDDNGDDNAAFAAMSSKNRTRVASTDDEDRPVASPTPTVSVAASSDLDSDEAEAAALLAQLKAKREARAAG
jgi:hypothetical protein